MLLVTVPFIATATPGVRTVHVEGDLELPNVPATFPNSHLALSKINSQLFLVNGPLASDALTWDGIESRAGDDIALATDGSTVLLKTPGVYAVWAAVNLIHDNADKNKMTYYAGFSVEPAAPDDLLAVYNGNAESQRALDWGSNQFLLSLPSMYVSPSAAPVRLSVWAGFRGITQNQTSDNAALVVTYLGPPS